MGHFVKKVKVWLTIFPKPQHSANWFSMKVWALRILILNPIVSGMELQPMITMTSSAVENIQQGMSHIFEILLKPCFKNAISSSEQQQSLLWWFNNQNWYSLLRWWSSSSWKWSQLPTLRYKIAIYNFVKFLYPIN